MSQFRKTGNYYVSQWNGDDLNAGTDPELPKASITSVPTGAGANHLILGTGVYAPYTGNRTIVADGLAIIEGNGTQNISDNGIKEGIYYRNLNAFNTGNYNTKTNCIFQNVPTIAMGNVNPFNNGIILLSEYTPTGFVGNIQVSNSIIVGNQTGNRWRYFQYNYVAKSSLVCLEVRSDCVNNCINGKITVDSISGTQYESKKLIDGSVRPDANASIPDIIDVFPEFYNQGNFSSLQEDVKIIDLVSRTVEPDSILIQKSNSYGYIGGVKVGKEIAIDESGFTITKTGIDDTNPNSWAVADGVNFAKVRITGKVSDSLISAQTLDIRIPFFFDGSEAGGSANNNNVPDAWNNRTTPDTKGTKPNRLTFEVRSSVLANPGRDTAADWDNGDAGIPGNYYLMEYGQPLLHHIVSSVAYGNADANAINAPVKQPFNYRSLDIIITITNNREI